MQIRLGHIQILLLQVTRFFNSLTVSTTRFKWHLGSNQLGIGYTVCSQFVGDVYIMSKHELNWTGPTLCATRQTVCFTPQADGCKITSASPTLSAQNAQWEKKAPGLLVLHVISEFHIFRESWLSFTQQQQDKINFNDPTHTREFTDWQQFKFITEMTQK